MNKNTLLDHWTGSGELVKKHTTARDDWKRKANWTMGSIAVLIMLFVAGSTWFPILSNFAFAALGVFVVSAIVLTVWSPESEHAQDYFQARDRLAKALGMDPSEIESMDYDRLCYGVVLPTIDGLFAKLRAQAGSNYRAEAAATYRELDDLYSVCPRFRLLEETDGRYLLEPLEFYTGLLVSA